MESKRLTQTLMIVGGVILGIYASVTIILNPTGGISGLSKLLAILGVLVGIVNPRAGLYLLAAQAIYADEIKRIGVYYGVQSTQTVSEILIGPLLTICAINLSFLHGVLRRQFKIDFLGVILYLIAPAVAVALIIKGRDSGLMLSVYMAGTTALYITVIPVCYGIFRSMEEWISYISWQAVLAAPAAAWGIVQYFNGFNGIEWTYALSGLSQVHTMQMMQAEPRIFGLFGSVSAFGCVALYGIFCFWRAFRIKKMRILFLLLGALYVYVTILSQQRTLLLFPLIVVVFAFCFRRRITTGLLYAGSAAIFVLGVLNSTYLIEEGLDKVNRVIAGEGRWAKNVLNVSTYSDRLRGWERLTRPDSWTLFGSEERLVSSILEQDKRPNYSSEEYNHDIINKILINFGAVGLALAAVVVGFLLFRLHRVIFNSPEWQYRKDGAFVMACIVPALILSFIGGGNFTTTPINLQTWSILAGIFLLKKISTPPAAAPFRPLASAASGHVDAAPSPSR